jgi:putative transposase
MALSFLYLITRRLLGLLLGRFQTEHAKDVEIAVLRHQLEVLHRQVSGPSSGPLIVRCSQCGAKRLLGGAGRSSW